MIEKNDFELVDFLPYLLNQAAERSSLGFQKVYKDRYGMLRTEWRVLFHLGVYGAMSAKEICERSQIHKTKVSRAVQKLAERRFLSRERDENDRRVERLELTKIGKSAFKDLYQVAQDYDENFTKDLSSDEVFMLKQILRKLA